MQVNVKKLHPSAKLPTYATEGAAAFDLYAVEDAPWLGDLVAVKTGLAFAVPEGYALFIKPRSGLRYRLGVEAFAGTIDADYRGELVVLLERRGDGISADVWWAARAGDRIAQAVILPLPRAEFVEVDELTETTRGAGGFGSTGK